MGSPHYCSGDALGHGGGFVRPSGTSGSFVSSSTQAVFTWFWVRFFASVRVACRRLAPPRLALWRLVSWRLAPWRLAPRRLAPWRLVHIPPNLVVKSITAHRKP